MHRSFLATQEVNDKAQAFGSKCVSDYGIANCNWLFSCKENIDEAGKLWNLGVKLGMSYNGEGKIWYYVNIDHL